MSEIDVSKCVDIYQCETFNHCISQSKLTTNSNCNANKDCYYKQLQQLKQENEELTTKFEKIKEIVSPHCSQCNEILQIIEEK